MGRKSSAKTQTQAGPAPPAQPPRTSRGPLIALTLIGVAVVGLFVFGRSGSAPDPASQPQPVPTQTLAEPAAAKFGPHHQNNLPPLPFAEATPVRPIAEVTAAYTFAAEHPEVLGYVPCYCGCERQGHRGNDDCFVSRRAPNGDVVEWEPHGMT
jgi:uncharacterized protein with PCYCGC motif